MNIEHIAYFRTVAEVGSINKAAHLLFISQPQLGKIIRDLEDELGVMLLQRTRRGVTLTADGSEFLAHADAMLEEYQKIRTINLRSAHRDSSLEVSMTKFSHIMESFIAVVCAHGGDTEFSHKLSEGSPEDVVEDVFSRLSKIGVLNFDSRRRSRLMAGLEAKGLSYHTLARVTPHILVAEDHPLLQSGKKVTLQSLADYPFVRYMGQYEDFTNCIRCESDELNLNKNKRIVYVASRSALLHLIGSSDFYGIGIYDFRVQESAYNVRSIPIESCLTQLEFGYILPAEQPISSTTQEFIENLQERFSTVE